MTKIKISMVEYSAIALLTLISANAMAADDDKLSAIHEDILDSYNGVQHLSTAAFSGRNNDDVVLFDVRETGEFSISHLQGAIRIPPDVTADDFIEMHKNDAEGKVFVFYCSVGHRSASLAERVQDKLESAGAAEVYNLEGGIFKWHNEQRALTNAGGDTDYVHPYNTRWGQLLARPSQIRYEIQTNRTGPERN